MFEQDQWAAVTFVKGPEGKTVFVLDRGKPLPHFWKMAGGRKEPGETPVQTAKRELQEETGLNVETRNIVLVEKVSKKNHDLYVYSVTVENFDGLIEEGDEGEKVAVFHESEVETMVDFFPPHRLFLKKLGVVLTA